MNYDELRTFIKLCEVKNFTKTAELLNMSQPTVSLHIKNLEAEFQTQLFLRIRKQLRLTPTGEILLDRAKQMSQLYDQAKQRILDHHEKIQGELKIGATFTIGEYILPTLLNDLKQQYPTLSLLITIANTEEIVRAVKLLQVDVGLIEGTTLEKEIIIEPFMKDELVFVCHKQHPLAVKDVITMNDLQNEDWVMREAGSGTGDYLRHVLQTNGLQIRSSLTISSSQGIKEAVILNLGLSLLSIHTIKRELELQIIHKLTLDYVPFTRTLSYIYAPTTQMRGNITIFLDTLKNYRASLENTEQNIKTDLETK